VPLGNILVAQKSAREFHSSTALRALARAYFTYFPIEKGKWRLWRKVAPYLSRNPSAEVEIALKYGVRARLDPADAIQRFVYYWGSWAPSETRVMRRLLRPGDTVIDAGANFGYFTLLASRIVGPTGQVVAFEPVPPTVQRLKRNLELNGATNVVLHECAVSDNQGTVRISKPSAQNSGANTIRTIEKPLDSWEVPSVRLDDVISGAIEVRVLKVDVEGAELMLVRGCRQHILAGLVPYVICEVHDEFLRELGSSSQEFFEVMTSYGYRAYDFERARLTPLSNLVPQTAEKRDQMNVLFAQRELEF
jgi:FkbM family methyltransferase